MGFGCLKSDAGRRMVPAPRSNYCRADYHQHELADRETEHEQLHRCQSKIDWSGAPASTGDPAPRRAAACEDGNASLIYSESIADWSAADAATRRPALSSLDRIR